MTNEEIEQRARALEQEYGIDLSASALTDFARSLVSEAYEEAARDAESYLHDIYIVQDVPAAMRCIATNIRQRKALLVQEPVAST